MIFRRAVVVDIKELFRVRMAVLENRLSDPALVTDDICRAMLTERGAGWVCEADGEVVGFAIVDLTQSNIWALFVHPQYEKKGIGRQLHDLMVNWSFENGQTKLWLTTGSVTRAEVFYKQAGWRQAGMDAKGEIRFELDNLSFREHQRSVPA